MDSSTDTIAAVATAPGEAAIAIIRMSGPDALTIGRQFLATRHRQPLPELLPRRAYLCELLGAGGDPVDDALVTWFPEPRSYTGENLLEIGVHGGQLPSRTALEQCLRCGARAARPGEFTLRAFLNGRIDLSQAEAVIDTIQAQTAAGLRLAHRQLTGRLSHRVQSIRAQAMGVLAQIEAAVDFPDDVDEPDRAVLAEELENAADLAVRMAAEARAGQIYREGIRVVIMGRPNVGKSSLLNALLRADRAIVTPVPGTTRDLIEETLSIGGVPVRAVDTAGLRETTDPVESIGVDRARSSIAGADLCLVVLDRSLPLEEADRQAVRESSGRPAVLVINKCDLPACWSGAVTESGLYLDSLTFDCREWLFAPLLVEAAVGRHEGVEAIEQAILHAIFRGRIIPADTIDAGSIRHAAALDAAAISLQNARLTALSPAPLDLISVDVRGAIQRLGEITGEAASTDLLHEIFSRFCIGK